MAQPDRGRQGHAAEDDLGRVERHAHSERPPADGRRPGLWRHHPVRPLHPADRRSLPGADPGLQRRDGAAARDHSRRQAVLPSLDRRARPRRALPAVQRAASACTRRWRRSRPRCPYLFADPARIAAWREKLDASCRPACRASAWPGPAGRRIPTTAAARCRLRGWRRSPPPCSASFVSLQKPMPAADLRGGSPVPGIDRPLRRAGRLRRDRRA